jgi:hypothetical protein
VAQTSGILEFGPEELVIYDAKKENKETISYTNGNSNVTDVYTMKLNLNDLKTTLETCVEEYLCLNFSDGSAAVLSRGNVKNVIPEIKSM